VLHRDRPGRALRLEPHADVRFAAVSPDGRWVATGSHGGSAQLKVWDAESGQLVRDLPAGGICDVGFSPDGKWLAATGRGPLLWAVPSWQPGPQFAEKPEGFFAFSPDSRLLAVETGHGAVQLLDPTTGREYATLEDPDQDRARPLMFSLDGTQLLAASNDSYSLHVWDLRVLRSRLASMGLDWDLPPYPPPKPEPVLPLQIRVVQR
jgi:WD40 repeat protein